MSKGQLLAGELATKVPETLEQLFEDYRLEIERAERWKLLYGGVKDQLDGANEQLRQRDRRIKTLENEIERLVNEGSSEAPGTDR